MKYLFLLLVLASFRAVGQTSASFTYHRVLPSKEWRLNYWISHNFVYIDGDTVAAIKGLMKETEHAPEDKVDTVMGVAITYSGDSILGYLVSKFPRIRDCYGCAILGAVHIDLTGSAKKITHFDFPEPVYDRNFRPLARNTIERFYIPEKKNGF